MQSVSTVKLVYHCLYDLLLILLLLSCIFLWSFSWFTSQRRFVATQYTLVTTLVSTNVANSIQHIQLALLHTIFRCQEGFQFIKYIYCWPHGTWSIRNPDYPVYTAIPDVQSLAIDYYCKNCNLHYQDRLVLTLQWDELVPVHQTNFTPWFQC